MGRSTSTLIGERSMRHDGFSRVVSFESRWCYRLAPLAIGYQNKLGYTSPFSYKAINQGQLVSLVTGGKTMHTHYAKNPDSKDFTVFYYEECEECGAKVCGPNAFNASPESALVARGLKKADSVPDDELGFCEATGTCTCSDCYQEEE
jgi:hypothetical protein